MSNCDKPNCTLKGDHVHAEVESPFKPTEEICEHHFESDFGLEPACTKCGAIQSMTESAKEGPYNSRERDSGGMVVSGPGIERIFHSRADAYIFEAELTRAWEEGCMSREADVEHWRSEYKTLEKIDELLKSNCDELRAEIESLKREVAEYKDNRALPRQGDLNG